MQFGTRASGVMRSIAMGIVKSDIRNVIQNGVPENILSWAQELGEGVDGMEKMPLQPFSMCHLYWKLL